MLYLKLVFSLVLVKAWILEMHVHLVNEARATPLRIPLPSKPFACSISPTKLVVAMSNRSNWIYELSALAAAAHTAATNPPPNINRALEPWQRRESSLKFMTRTVACMPDDDGYATSPSKAALPSSGSIRRRSRRIGRFEDGKEVVGGDVAVYIRELGETEARGKGQK
ncbi:hypothetical protein KEM56_004531 [Ascosphaera pollenicola]|nr:hypothetical protein KEM56_004531 [Ascosphaera pollenicola]